VDQCLSNKKVLKNTDTAFLVNLEKYKVSYSKWEYLNEYISTAFLAKVSRKLYTRIVSSASVSTDKYYIPSGSLRNSNCINTVKANHTPHVINGLPITQANSYNSVITYLMKYMGNGDFVCSYYQMQNNYTYYSSTTTWVQGSCP